ncbi:MAG: PAS domain S-box protein, partial [Phycisphaerales bacterium]
MIRRAIASMSRSLGAKVLAPVGVGCLVMIVGVFFGVREMGTQLALDRLSQRAQAIATMVSLAAETIQSQEQLERLVYSLGAERDVAQILVAGRSPRRVVASTRNEWNGRGGEVEELRRSFAEMERTLLTNRGSVELHSEIGEMDCKHPLLLRSSEGLVPGVVMVHIDAKPLFAAVQQWAVLGAMAAAGLAGATFLGVAYLVTRVVLSPLRAIVGAIAKDAPAAVMTHDEVGLLAEAFNARRAETARVRGSLEGALREIGALRTALDEHSILSITDSCGRIVDVNSGFCTLTGYSRGELLGNSHRILKSGAHPDGYWAEMWGQVKRGRAWRGEVCDRRKDGRLVWTDTTIVPCLDGTGEVEKYVAIRFDVTEQKLARAKIAESEARFRTLVEGAGVVVWEYDFGGGCFSYVSSQAIGLGYPLEEWLKPGFWEAHIHEEDRARAVAGRNRESGAGRSHRLRYRMLEASGEVVHVEEVVSVEMSGEKPVAMRGVLIDITPQVVREKVVQEQAERLDLTVNAAQLGTWDWDLPSGEVTFNEVAETMLGYEPG